MDRYRRAQLQAKGPNTIRQLQEASKNCGHMDTSDDEVMEEVKESNFTSLFQTSHIPKTEGLKSIEKVSFLDEDVVKKLISPFLQQYFLIYDSENRQPLQNVYYKEAILSFTANPVNSKGFGVSMGDTLSVKKFNKINYGRSNVITFLNGLAKTQHDVTTFDVKLNASTENLLVFTVTGLFKQTYGISLMGGSIFAFSRVFVAVPSSNSKLCLVNDSLSTRSATVDEAKRAFATISAPQQKMILEFSQRSQMNMHWSLSCLEKNQWDFDHAARMFVELKAKGSIPAEAFQY